MSLEATLIGYVQKHRSKGVLLDTNLLLLYIFSRFSPEAIGTGRVAEFDADSADLLMQYLSNFERILTTPHVLAETSNLARLTLKGKKWKAMTEVVFPLFCLPLESMLKPIEVITEILDVELFSNLGLTDSALAKLAENHLLLTADLDLYLAVVSASNDAINFNHMREVADLA